MKSGYHNTMGSARSMLAVLCCAVLLAACLLPCSSSAAEGSARPAGKTVRLGYYENDNFQSGASDGAVKKGYSYDYMQRLQLYTDWDYEYVYGEYGDLYQMLLAGEIDLLTGLAWREDRADLIGYPELAMGETDYTFLKQTARTDITSDPETIAGKKIGALEGAMTGIVQNYLDKNGITAEIVCFDSLGERDRALTAGEVDLTIVEGSTTAAMDGIESFATAGSSDYYVVVAKDRPDLLADLNAAQTDLFRADTDIREELEEKWLRQNAVSAVKTENELRWIEEHPAFTVGYYNDFLPYSDTDADGNVTGIVKDIVPELFRLLDIDSITVSYRGYDNYDEMIDALNAGEVDVLFPAYTEYWSAEKNNVMPTEEVISTYFELVYPGNYPDLDSAVIALPTSNKMLQAYQQVNLPDVRVEYYDTMEACLEALSAGRADATLVNGLRAAMLLLNGDFEGFHTAQIAASAPLGFAAGRSDSGTVEIINHALEMIDPDYALTQTYRYEEQQSVTFRQVFRQYWWAFALALWAVIAIVIFFILRELSRSRRFLAQETRQKQQLEEANNEQQVQIEEIQALNDQLEENQAQLEESASELEAQRDELKVARDQAEAANAAKTSFLFNMSHDIRTPMNAIMGFRDLLEKHQDDPVKRQDYLNKIQSASSVLLSILNNVLEMTRIEKGTLEVEETAWSIEQFVDTLYSVFQDMMEKKGLAFTRQIEVEHHYVYCDPTKLREIFLNILSNACKYTNPGGKVSMLLEEIPSQREGWVLYRTTISDTGIGMSEEFLPHIFEEFSREKNTTEAKVEGTGLGMPIVKRLVELLDGTIEVKSRKGVGSTFVVTIPHRIADKACLVEHAGVVIDPKLFKGRRLLMAEDNDLNAEIATEILEEAGFIVDRAEDGAICVNKLQEAGAGYYDLILMDIQMPNMNGYEATRAIRRLEDAEKANIKILAMTANAFEEDRREAMRAGMNGHLAKPINVSELMKTLASTLG